MRTPVPGDREVRHHRPPSRHRQQRAHGRGVRGAHSQVRGALQRDRRGALHPARGDPADGEPPVHRRRRCADQAGGGALAVRPHRGDRRDAERGGGAPRQPESRRAARDVRPGAEPRVLRDLQGRHADQGAGHRQHRLWQHAGRRRPAWQTVRLHALEPAVRGGVEEDREGGPQGSGAAGLQRPLRARPAAGERWLAAVPPPPPRQDAARRRWWQPLRHCSQRIAALHRRRRLGRERDPPLRAGERPGRGDHRAADRHVLQHRHQHLRVDCQQPEAGGAQGQGAVDRRQRLLAEDAQEPRQQAPGAEPRAHRGHHAALRRLRGVHPRRRADQPHLQEPRLRLPHHHRRASAARRGRRGRARDEGEGQRQAGARCRAARHGERAARRGCGHLLQARGAAARAGCVDRSREDEGRLRDSVQPASISRCYAGCTWTSGWPASRPCRPCPA